MLKDYSLSVSVVILSVFFSPPESMKVKHKPVQLRGPAHFLKFSESQIGNKDCAEIRANFYNNKLDNPLCHIQNNHNLLRITTMYRLYIYGLRRATYCLSSIDTVKMV